MTNTTTPSAPSGEQNLDHLEALAPCPFCESTNLHIETNSVQPDDYHDAWVHCDECDADGRHAMTLEGWLSSKDEAKAEAVVAWNRRTAPVSAPIAGDALPPLPEPWIRNLDAPEGSRDHFAADQMHDYARAALTNQPAPTAALEQVAQGADERRRFEAYYLAKHKADGYPLSACLTTERAQEAWDAWLAALSQPSEAAPLNDASRDKAQMIADYLYKNTNLGGESAARAGKALWKLFSAAPSLPAAAPAAGDDLRRWLNSILRTGTHDERVHARQLRNALDAGRHVPVHQPAQEQATPPVVRAPGDAEQLARLVLEDPAGGRMVISSDLNVEPRGAMSFTITNPRTRAMAKVRIAIEHDFDPVVRAQSEESAGSLLSADELAALRRFDETCQDGEGYDVPKEMMRRLAEIGVVRRTTRDIYETTQYGLAVLTGRTQQAHTGADEARRQAFVEVGEKMRANVRPDELARFVDSEILKPRAAIRAAQEGGA